MSTGTNPSATGSPGDHAASAARAVVADDHPLYRAGIVGALLETGRFAVLGEAANGLEAFELIVRYSPDLAVVDVRMPRLDGLGLLSRLAAHDITIPILLLSAFTDRAVVDRAFMAGAAGYVAKQADREEIVAAAEAIAVGGSVWPRSRDGDGQPILLPIERTILGILRDGWALGDIPRLTGLDRTSAERYAHDAAARLNVATPDDAVASAMAWGLLE
jgi:two-component system, NarL family, nitrate/nitrite response regulator NarL